MAAHGVETADRGEHRSLLGAAGASIEHAGERELVARVLVDVGNAQLGLPQPGVVSPAEHLPLLGDSAYHRLQGRVPVRVAEGAALDLLHHAENAATDGAKVLQPLFPREPGAAGGAWVVSPAQDQLARRFVMVRHGRSVLRRRALR